ncbi:MAG: response regulator [Lachnospiraceae bacterium]|jgi:DNA-binding response OmpR family regulator|nr:response regulator [Lachnospiraceae bacterium]
MEKMKILVVDDNTVNLALVEQELQDIYDVTPVISGRRAINFLYRERVDLILLDVQMPIMDGVETLKEIRRLENGVTVPVVFLTARKEKSAVLAGSKLGIMDYILKPFDGDDLIKRIETIFKKLGKIPIEQVELVDFLKKIEDHINAGNYDRAHSEIDGILSYKLDKEIRERMAHIKGKVDSKEYGSALSMLDRVIKYINVHNQVGFAEEERIPINEGEINVKLLYLLDDLENFKMQEVNTKLTNLLKYDMPEYIYETLKEAKQKVEDFDDGAAEEMIKQLLEEMRNPQKQFK